MAGRWLLLSQDGVGRIGVRNIRIARREVITGRWIETIRERDIRSLPGRSTNC
jgi:hypothetical protein